MDLVASKYLFCMVGSNYVDYIMLKVTGYLELYDFIHVYIYATKTGILKS